MKLKIVMIPKHTEIEELGEFGLIDRIKRKTKISNPETTKGIGDDAAVIDRGACYEVITTDLLLDGIHFDLSFMPLQHLGYKAISVNVSDIAAMNAMPKQITVGVGLSNRFSVEAVDALYSGIMSACEDYGVDLIGGDTSSSRSGLIISITAIGEVEKDRIAYRSGAQKRDILCVTGDLGAAYLGLQILLREKEVFKVDPTMQPNLDQYSYLVGRQLKPVARTDIIYDLKEKGVVPTSCIDISDGLSSELFHISKESDIGVDIFEDKLPIASQALETAMEFNIPSGTCVLNGGDDYELLFTIKQDDYEKIKIHPDIHFIGYVKEKENGLRLISKQGEGIPLRSQGWDHFKK